MDSHTRHENSEVQTRASASGNEQTLKDPVCDMDVEPATAAGSYEYKGTTFYFCCEPCLERFRSSPEEFIALTKPAPRAPAAAAGADYTCPMDPEVHQSKPGACPKCGMALEPEMPSLEEKENPELADFRRRFWRTLPLTIVTLILAMWGHRLLPSVPAAALAWTQLVLASPVVLWAAWPAAAQELRRILYGTTASPSNLPVWVARDAGYFESYSLDVEPVQIRGGSLITLAIITGIFGMNFEHMGVLKWGWGFSASLELMAMIAGLLAWVFKRRGWW